MHDRGLATDVLHDVDLAALRPTDRLDVAAKHPEGGPDTLTPGNPDACFDPTISARKESLRLESARRVETLPVPARVGRRRWLRERGDHQVAISVERHVLCARRVELSFLVAEAVSSGVRHPLRPIE